MNQTKRSVPPPSQSQSRATNATPWLSGPLHIDFVQTPVGGEIGLTHCPGRNTIDRMGRQWQRDLRSDLDTIDAVGIKTLVTLLDEHELSILGAGNLPVLVQHYPMRWIQFPIVDFGVPADRDLSEWRQTVLQLQAQLQRNERVLFHCAAGLGRSGMMAATLLKSCGLTAGEAVRRIRAGRPGTVETPEQEAFILEF